MSSPSLPSETDLPTSLAALSEVALCTDLHHTYLTQCLDSFVDADSGRLGIVMPFYSGGDLSAVVKKNAARGTR